MFAAIISKKSKMLLTFCFMEDFKERNPNFYVFNAVKHMDEKTPHIHLNYIPVATDYKRGMEVQNGHAKALEQMGYGNAKNSIDSWRKNERAAIRDLCNKYGIELAEESKGRGKTYTPNEYKKIRDEVKDELRAEPLAALYVWSFLAIIFVIIPWLAFKVKLDKHSKYRCLLNYYLKYYIRYAYAGIKAKPLVDAAKTVSLFYEDIYISIFG